MHSHPGLKYQAFVQHPQNWQAKGWIALFQYTDSYEDVERETKKAERFLGIFDYRIEELDFYSMMTQACLDYRFSKMAKRKTLTLGGRMSSVDMIQIDNIKLGYRLK